MSNSSPKLLDISGENQLQMDSSFLLTMTRELMETEQESYFTQC